MRQWRRWGKPGLVMLLAAVLILGGCSKSSPKESATTSSPQASATTAATADTSKAVTLTMYVLGEKPSGFDAMMEQFNPLIQKKINTTLKVNWIGWGDYQDKYPLLLSSGESFDLIYTATWLNFSQLAQKGAFMPLEKLVPEYAPKSWEQTSAIARKEATINGHLYALPSGKSTYNAYGVIVRGDLMEKYKIPDIKTFQDLGVYLQTIKDKEPSMQPADIFAAGSELDDLYMMNHGLFPLPGSIYWLDPNAEKPSIMAKPDWEKMPEFLQLMSQWSKAGYWSKSALSNKEDNMTETGKAAMKIGNIDNWAGMYLQHPQWNFRFFNFASQYETLSYMQDAMAIPNSAKNPERALQFLELMRTDREAYDLFTYGTSQDSKIHEDGTVEALRPNEFPLDNIGWGFRTDTLTRDTYGVPKAFIDMKKNIQANLKENKFRAFTMNTDPVKNQFAAVQNVMAQYYDPLELGFVDPVTGLKNLNKQMGAAGNEKIKQELQKQIDEFAANYNK
jgi:putative aldouronate transport system substrate-binding protein